MYEFSHREGRIAQGNLRVKPWGRHGMFSQTLLSPGFDRLSLRYSQASTGSAFDAASLRQAQASISSGFDTSGLRQAQALSLWWIRLFVGETSEDWLEMSG